MRVRCYSFIVLLVSIILGTAATPARGATLLNGGFETPLQTLGNYLLITPGNEPVGFDWIVVSGDVDISHLPVTPYVEYAAYEGVQALDLNGNTNGTIRQDFATQPGQAYLLSFAYADNPFAGGTSTASVAVTDVGTSGVLLSGNVSHSTSTNGPPPSADWQIFESYFTATGPLTRLTFASTSPDVSPSGGIVIDAVAVSLAVPEPATFGLALVAAGGLTLARIGQRKR
ncbi:MAG: DUF642 domain-containing protein [Planctomycetaceae bacterium]|nr:DUF642 domain-containing protein [Planctomycetaceae bacterium]